MIFLEDFEGFDPTADPTFGDTTGMDGMPGIFVFFFVVTLVLGVGSFVWKISTARDLARRAGMDPDEATAMTIMTENGLESTYLASNLRNQTATTAAKPAAERLAELASLRDSGAITEDEHAERRREIIDSV